MPPKPNHHHILTRAQMRKRQQAEEIHGHRLHLEYEEHLYRTSANFASTKDSMLATAVPPYKGEEQFR